MTRKGQITLQMRLVLANEGLANPYTFTFSSFLTAKLAKEFFYTWHSELQITLWGKDPPALESYKMKWPQLLCALNICAPTVVCIEYPIHSSTPKQPIPLQRLAGQGWPQDTVLCNEWSTSLFSLCPLSAHLISINGQGRVHPRDTCPVNACPSFPAFPGTIRKKMVGRASWWHHFICCCRLQALSSLRCLRKPCWHYLSQGELLQGHKCV